jgi:hypothetical protein
MRRLAFLGLTVVLAGCGGGQRLAVYLPQRLGPEGPPGQRAPVLVPVERERRASMSPVRQAVLELMVGPAPSERARGFADALPPGTRADRVRLEGRRRDDRPPRPGAQLARIGGDRLLRHGAAGN